MSARSAGDDRLPELDVCEDDWCRTSADLLEVGSVLFLLLPFAPPMGISRGRRYLVAIGGSAPQARLVLSVGNRAAIVPPANLTATERPVEVHIRALPNRRFEHAPPDLIAALARERVNIDALPDHELRHVLAMIEESSSEHVREARIKAAVTAILAAMRRINGQPP